MAEWKVCELDGSQEWMREHSPEKDAVTARDYAEQARKAAQDAGVSTEAARVAAESAANAADRAERAAESVNTDEIRAIVAEETERATAVETGINDALANTPFIKNSLDEIAAEDRDGLYWIPDFDSAPPGSFVSVKDFGAKGDGVTDDTSALQGAINSATSEGKSVYFPAGEYIVTHKILLPKKSTFYGAVSLVGESSQYAFGIRRRDVGGGVNVYPVFGTVIRCDFTNSVLFETNRTFVNLENISFRDCTAAQKSRGTNAFALNGDLDSESSDNRSRFYARECSFIGFKSVIGSEDTKERVAYHVSRCRFEKCGTGLVNGIDSSVVDSAFSGGKHAIVFDILPSGSSGAGASTVLQNRIEWTSDAGVKIASNYVRNVLISANEFDRCGGPSVAIFGGKNISITNNVFRRSGANSYEKYNNESYHVFLADGESILLSGNSTRLMKPNDQGTGADIPNNGFYKSDSCTNVIMNGNDWSGAITRQLDDSSIKTMSIPANTTVQIPFVSYLGLISVCTYDKYGRGGIAYVSTNSSICVKYAGGDKFFTASNGVLPDSSTFTVDSVYLAVKDKTLYIRNTSSSTVSVTLKAM